MSSTSWIPVLSALVSRGAGVRGQQRGQRGEERSRRFLVQNEALRGGEQRAGGDYGHPGPVDRAEDGREQLRYAPARLRAGRQVAAESELGDDLRDPLIDTPTTPRSVRAPIRNVGSSSPLACACCSARAQYPMPASGAVSLRESNRIKATAPPPRCRWWTIRYPAVRPDPARPPRAVRSAPGSARGPARSRCGVHGWTPWGGTARLRARAPVRTCPPRGHQARKSKLHESTIRKCSRFQGMAGSSGFRWCCCPRRLRSPGARWAGSRCSWAVSRS